MKVMNIIADLGSAAGFGTLGYFISDEVASCFPSAYVPLKVGITAACVLGGAYVGTEVNNFPNYDEIQK